MSFPSPRSGPIDRPAATVFVVDPAAGLGAQIPHFAARFGLTGAETRVLTEIIGGDGLLATAAKLKINAATARTHAKRILAKTGTTRQTKLIRRFFETALPGSPCGARIFKGIKTPCAWQPLSRGCPG